MMNGRRVRIRKPLDAMKCGISYLPEDRKLDGIVGDLSVRDISTFLAQFVDNLVFALLVSRVFFGWTMLQCFTCAVTGAIFELFFEA